MSGRRAPVLVGLGILSLAARTSLIFVSAIAVACRKLRIMTWGCTPSSTNVWHWRRSSPARSTTLVVPSPT